MDMAGNVWEWTRSLFKPYPYQAEDGRENLGVPDSELRVARGGSFLFSAVSLRAAYRDRFFPGSRYNNLGFRVVFSRLRP